MGWANARGKRPIGGNSPQWVFFSFYNHQNKSSWGIAEEHPGTKKVMICYRYMYQPDSCLLNS
jgi:hypothetical protein